MMSSQFRNRLLVYYTDGGYRSSTKIGAWAYIGFNFDISQYLRDSRLTETAFNSGKYCWSHGVDYETTSNRMEMTGLLQCLISIPLGSVAHIHSDSKYVLHTLVDPKRLKEGAVINSAQGIDGWYQKWRQSNFNNKKNLDLWFRLVDQIETLRKNGTSLFFFHVPGHSGNLGNDQADYLVNLAMNRALCDE